MIKKSLLLASMLLSAQALLAEGSLATIKYGITSLNNDDGFDFSKHSFRADAMFDLGYEVKPRLGLGYINIDESPTEGGVSSAIQLDLEGVYEIESKYVLTPYILAGMGYEYIVDSRPNFDSQFYIDGGFGLRYPLQNRINIVTEFKGIRVISGDDQSSEFAFYIGVGLPFGATRAPIDSDRDGIFDYADMCPNTPVGTSVGIDGCPLPTQAKAISYQDSDGDSVPDGRDICPNTPAGTGVSENGCAVRQSVQAQAFEPTILGDTVTQNTAPTIQSIPDNAIILGEEIISEVIDETSSKVNASTYSGDSDNDGVDDSRDQCLNTPKGFTVNSLGCALKRNLNVKFEPNSSSVAVSSKLNIRKFADFLKRYPNAHVEVVGYTDSSGNRHANKLLSAKRARIVKDLLVRYGIASSKITAIGKGDLNPIATNDTARGREMNRRIEVEIK